MPFLGACVGRQKPEAPARQSGTFPSLALRVCVGRLWLCHRARLALLWAGVMMAALQFSLALALERWPQIRYPEFGFKLAQLRQRLAELPEQPLVLLFGSSRTEVGVCAEKFDFSTAARPPMVFNFALSSAGPIQHLMLLESLLSEGVCCNHLFVEVHPLFLNQVWGNLREEARIDIHHLGPSDLAVLTQFSENSRELRRTWWKGRLLPSHAFRHQWLDCWRSPWCAGVKQYEGFSRVGPLGWLPFPLRAKNEEEHQKMLEHTRWDYKNFKNFDFQVTEEPDRALRKLLSICRDRQIGVTLYLMPEGSEFQPIYPPHSRERVDTYLAKLGQEFDFQLIDASGWMSDASFADGHHLLPEAAHDFSQRFAREILAPSLGSLTTAPDTVR